MSRIQELFGISMESRCISRYRWILDEHEIADLGRCTIFNFNPFIETWGIFEIAKLITHQRLSLWMNQRCHERMCT